MLGPWVMASVCTPAMRTQMLRMKAGAKRDSGGEEKAERKWFLCWM